MSQNFRLFHVSNLAVRNFRTFRLMYPESVLERVLPCVPGSTISAEPLLWLTALSAADRPAERNGQGAAEGPTTADTSGCPGSHWSLIERDRSYIVHTHSPMSDPY